MVRHLGFTENYGIHEADGSAQIPQPFCYRRSFMYAAVSDISYIAERPPACLSIAQY